MNQKSLDAIRKAIKFKYDEHIGELIFIPNVHLDKIVPNRGLPSNTILKGFNKDSGKELFRYGEEIISEISRILDKLKPSKFSDEDKNSILVIVDEYCKPELYLKRFTIMLDSIERRFGSYGHKINLAKNNISIARAICKCYAYNNTQRIRSKIENELDCLVESYQSQNTGIAGKVIKLVDCFELKPNFLGLGLNLNAFINKLLRKKT